MPDLGRNEKSEIETNCHGRAGGFARLAACKAASAAMSLALPKADPGVHLTLSFCITFSFNLIAGPAQIDWLGVRAQSGPGQPEGRRATAGSRRRMTGHYAPVSSLRWTGDDDDDGSLG